MLSGVLASQFGSTPQALWISFEAMAGVVQLCNPWSSLRRLADVVRQHCLSERRLLGFPI